MDESEIAKAFNAIGHSTRIAILRLLAESDGNVPAGQIARILGVRQNTLSSHLSVLSRSGLVVGHRLGREICYRISQDDLLRLAIFLDSRLCRAQGRETRQSFARPT